jgi:hypothetical protein
MRLENSRYYKFGAVSFAVSDLASLEEVILAMFPDPKPTNFEVSFRNVTNQTMIAEAADEITSDNYLIPTRLVNPSISASSTANNMTYSVLIGGKRIVGSDQKMETRYGLFVDTEDAVWHARVDTVIAWLRGHRAWYSGVTQILLCALLFAIIIGSVATITTTNHIQWYLQDIAIVTLVAAFLSMLYVLSLPMTTIIVRPDNKARLLPTVLAVVTTVSALLSAIGGLRSFFGKP